MTLKLDIPKETEAGLLAQAHARGLSLEDYAKQVLNTAVFPTQAEAIQHARELAAGEPFWKSFTRQVHALPDTVFEHLPEDGASEHDHYLYGAPKRNA